MSNKVDIIMPCYNAERFIGESIESILDQTLKDFCLIIIDDGSKDNTLSIIEEYEKNDSRIRVIRNEKNIGVFYSRNRGLDASTADFIAFMDADDISPVYRLETELRFLENNPDVGVVAGDIDLIDEEGKFIRSERKECYSCEQVLSEFLFLNPINNSSAMIRSSVIRENNIRFEKVEVEDYHFWMQIIRKAKIVILPEILLYYRINSLGLTSAGRNKRVKEYNDCLDMIRNEFMDHFDLRLSGPEKRVVSLCAHIDKGYDGLNPVEKILYAVAKRKVKKQLKGYYD